MPSFRYAHSCSSVGSMQTVYVDARDSCDSMAVLVMFRVAFVLSLVV